MEKAINDRLPIAEPIGRTALLPYPLPYFYTRVRNFLMFYVVVGDVMAVRRIVSIRRDMTEQL